MMLSSLIITALAGIVTAQFPAEPEGITLLRSRFNNNVTISYKEVCLIESSSSTNHAEIARRTTSASKRHAPGPVMSTFRLGRWRISASRTTTPSTHSGGSSRPATTLRMHRCRSG